MAELFDTRYFNGQGPVYLGERNLDGSPRGLIFIGDCSSVSLTPSVDKETVIENVTGSSGVGAEFIKKIEYQFAMQMRSIKPEHLAIALQGSNTAKPGATVTNEEQTGYLGKFIVLRHTKVSAVTVTNSAGSTTYVAGTDYILHADKGMVEIPPTGSAITEAQALLIDYTYAAQHHISAAPANKKWYLTFAGINRADNSKQTRCEIYRIALSPSALGMIADNNIEMPLSGTVELDTLRPAGDQFFSWKTED